MKQKVLFFLAVFCWVAVAKDQTVTVTKSELNWTGTKKLGSSHTGTLKLKSGSYTLKDGHLEGGKFEVDMTSLSNKDLEGDPNSKGKLEGHLKSPDFFDTEKFPVASLVLGKKLAHDKFQGQLTIKGKTSPVDIQFNHNGKGYKGTLEFDRTKYDVKYGSSTFFGALGADKIINDKVTVDFLFE